MKNIFLFLFTFTIISCKSQSSTAKDTLGMFYVERTDSNFIKLQKRPLSLKIGDTIIHEKTYTLNIPNSYIKINSSVTEIPNEIIFEFPTDAKIFLFGNKWNNKISEMMDIDKKTFMKQVTLQHLYTTELDKQYYNFKDDKHFGIRVDKEYVIFTLMLIKMK